MPGCRGPAGAPGGSGKPVDAERELGKVYWLLVKETGWTYPEIDALLLSDFEEIAAQWARASEEGTVEEAQDMPTGPRELTEEEFRRIAGAEEAFAEKHGRQRNPFL